MTTVYSVSIHLVLETIGAFHKLNLIVSILIGKLIGMPFEIIVYKEFI